MPELSPVIPADPAGQVDVAGAPASPSNPVDRDPSGIAAAVVALVTALFAAIDPSGLLGARWSPVLLGVVALVLLLVVRARAWAPGQVRAVATRSAQLGRLAGLDEVRALAPADPIAAAMRSAGWSDEMVGAAMDAAGARR